MTKKICRMWVDPAFKRIMDHKAVDNGIPTIELTKEIANRIEENNMSIEEMFKNRRRGNLFEYKI